MKKKIDNITDNFLKNDIGGIIVTSADLEILYCDARTALSDNVKKRIAGHSTHMPPSVSCKSWELTDTASGKYYRIMTSAADCDGETVYCHHITDVSDYADLYQEIAAYSQKISDVSDFQTEILKSISGSYVNCLPILADFCMSDCTALYLEDNGRNIFVHAYYDEEIRLEKSVPDEEKRAVFACERFGSVGGSRCLLSETLNEYRYSVFVSESEGFNEEYFRDISIYNVIRLYIENSILRERIIFEGEHDRLTGLYNQSKFLTLRSEHFGSPKTLAVFTFDVNDLKYMNDHFGHDAGDNLIKKAADSIRAVMNENVLGFRLGGDEFMLTALNVTAEEAENIHVRWKTALDELNRKNDNINCSVACGMAFGKGDYDLGELIEQADIRMYCEKRRSKDERLRLNNSVINNDQKT